MLKTSPSSSSKYHRVFVFGMKSSGKSSLLEQLIFGKRPACDSLLTSPSPSVPSAVTVSMASSVPLSSSSSHNMNHHYNNAIHNNGSCHYNHINSPAQFQLSSHQAPGHHTPYVHHHLSSNTVHQQQQQNAVSHLEIGTIEDIYSASIGSEDKGFKELVHFYESPGIPNASAFSPEVIKNCIHYADAFVLVYSINSAESFVIMESVKKCIDKSREKRDVPILVLGNKLDRFRERRLDMNESLDWAVKEKVHLCEVTATERSSLIEPFIYLASRLNPSSQSKFDRLNKLSSKRTTSQLNMEL